MLRQQEWVSFNLGPHLFSANLLIIIITFVYGLPPILVITSSMVTRLDNPPLTKKQIYTTHTET